MKAAYIQKFGGPEVLQFQDVEVGAQHGLDRFDSVLGIDVSRAQKKYPDQRFTLKDSQSPKIGVVSDDHASIRSGESQQIHIGSALKARFDHIQHVEANSPKVGNDIGIDIFVRQKRKVAQFHASTSAVTRSRSSTTSGP